MFRTNISNHSQSLSPLQLLNQPKQDLTSLGNALNSGDLAGAQTAFSAFQQDLQKIQAGTQSGTTPAKDFQTLQDALSSGDLAGAKRPSTPSCKMCSIRNAATIITIIATMVPPLPEVPVRELIRAAMAR